jgi:hypothetical protein
LKKEATCRFGGNRLTKTVSRLHEASYISSMTVVKVAVFVLSFALSKYWNYPAEPIRRGIILPM